MRKACFLFLVLLSLFVASSVCAGQLEDGLAAYERGEYEKAFALLRPLAEQGDTTAQYTLGDMYLKGQGVSENDSEAVKWYFKAAEKGNTLAQYRLGYMYAGGWIVPKDEVEAAKWYRKAAEQGYARAQYNLGIIYSKGQGVPKEEAEATKWYRKAAEEGHVYAQFELGDRYAFGLSVPKNEAEAVKWYRKAAEQGNADLQVKLGDRFANGQGVPKDEAEAVQWYRKAAEQGHAYIQFKLGVIYELGLGVPKDEAEAVKWFRKAAERGANPIISGVQLLDLARGVPRDDSEAMKLYREAAEQGDAAAKFYLGFIYERGLGVLQNDSEAAKWYRKAAEQGYAFAQFIIGNRYANGHEVQKSVSAAVDWFYKAGISYLKDGQREMALTALDRINSNSPGHWLGRKLQQAIYSGNGNTSEEPFGSSEEIELQESISQGTGWFVAPGIVVSNFHVLEGKGTIMVFLPGEKKFPATLVTHDEANDIALLKINAPASMLPKAFPIARSPAKVGSRVFTIGYPHPDVMGVEPKLTSGDVNSEKGLMDDPRFYQISVPIQAGNSGGPLLNLNGEVVGIVTSKLQAVGMAVLTGDLTQNVNYALKSQYLLPLLDEGMDRSPGNLLSNATAPLEELVIRAKSSVVMILAK